ncbi:MAG: D-glycero-beta-D-manno-heptose 1-phosphate adenylyltransferase [Nitrospirae bacterium]|nr:D-glycero-beta-D-manno-heptose 1-phosphate adenylyltransferase [Nitrospirota bacterium]
MPVLKYRVGEVLDISNLCARLETLRRSGKKIVFTNGCFDMIHPGHVRYLREAAALGDVLVVGLNSDESVSRLKPGRPVNPASHRAEVLAALTSVDFVTVFHEDTPYNLIRAVMPDVLVKGGDWRPENIVGSDIVADTRSLPFAEGFSTTSIIEKILSTKP